MVEEKKENRLPYLLCLAILAVIFGMYALWLGYDTVVIGAVFALLGTIGGYIYGKRQAAEDQS